MTELIIKPVNGKPAAKVIPLKRCGNCWWHAPTPGAAGMVMCQSVPPVPILLGMTQDALGRPMPQILSFWPQAQADQKACRLWTPPQGPHPDEQLG